MQMKFTYEIVDGEFIMSPYVRLLKESPKINWTWSLAFFIVMREYSDEEMQGLKENPGALFSEKMTFYKAEHSLNLYEDSMTTENYGTCLYENIDVSELFSSLEAIEANVKTCGWTEVSSFVPKLVDSRYVSEGKAKRPLDVTGMEMKNGGTYFFAIN